MKTKEFIIALFFILVSLVVYNYFPANDTFQQIITTIVFFVMIPLFFNKFILKNTFQISTFINIKEIKQGMLWCMYSLIILFFIFFVAAYYFDFLNKYSVPLFIVKDFPKFLFYEFIIVLPFVFLYEFYFRGFILNIFKEKLHYWAIILQALIFLSLALVDKNDIIQFLPYIIFAPFAGIIAYKSKSIVFSGAMQFIIIFVLNIIIIKKVG